PIITVAAAPRLTTTAKGKQPARATSLNDPSEHGGSSTNEGTGSKLEVLNVPSDDSKEEISWNSFDEEDVDAQDKGRNDDEGKKNDESDARKDDDDDDQDDAERDDEEDQGLRVSEEQRLIEEEEADELYHDVDINQGRGIQVSQDIEDSHVTLTSVTPDDRVKSLEVNFSEFMQTNQFAEAVSNISGIVHQYMTQQMTGAVREAV
nr:hypothetical protein [Tanacetum cinerariifolium]